MLIGLTIGYLSFEEFLLQCCVGTVMFVYCSKIAGIKFIQWLLSWDGTVQWRYHGLQNSLATTLSLYTCIAL